MPKIVKWPWVPSEKSQVPTVVHRPQFENPLTCVFRHSLTNWIQEREEASDIWLWTVPGQTRAYRNTLILLFKVYLLSVQGYSTCSGVFFFFIEAKWSMNQA